MDIHRFGGCGLNPGLVDMHWICRIIQSIWSPSGGSLWSRINGQINQDVDKDSGVPISGWQNSAVVKSAMAIQTGKE